jgi:superoxide dismutase
MPTKPRKTEEERIRTLQTNAENARKFIINKSDLKTAYEEKIKQITDDYEDIITKQKATYEDKLNNTIETMEYNFNKQIEQNRLNLITEHTAEINKLTDKLIKQNEAINKGVKQDMIKYYSAILDDKENMLNYFKDIVNKTLTHPLNKPHQQEEQSGYLKKQDLINGSFTETLQNRFNHSVLSRVSAETFGG